MSIADTPEILTWTTPWEAIRGIHARFSRSVEEALAQKLAALDPPTARLLGEGLGSLAAAARERLLLAPETTYRLLWAGEGDFVDFMQRSIIAEQALCGGGVALQSEVWTALGDAVIRPPGRVVPGAAVAGLAAIDYDSPYATTIDISGVRQRVDKPRPPLQGADRKVSLQRLEAALHGISQSGETVARFVRLFTKVLILQRDDSEGFSSGSNGEFVGRSLIGNPQLQGKDEVDVAEAVVHEAIHSLLYMQELEEPWVASAEPHLPAASISSPWTGRSLALRPFLQASFVWYGLLHFWSGSLLGLAFDPVRIHRRMAHATVGFLGAPLLDGLAEDQRTQVVPQVRLALEKMQADVQRAFQGIAG